jgi:hypothetical protein
MHCNIIGEAVTFCSVLLLILDAHAGRTGWL